MQLTLGHDTPNAQAVVLSGNTAFDKGGALYMCTPTNGFIGAACFTANTAVNAGGAIYFHTSSSASELRLAGGLQSFGANAGAAASGPSIYVDGPGLLTCAYQFDDTTSQRISPGPYTIEGHICTDYATSFTPTNYCPSDDLVSNGQSGGNTCMCSAGFDSSTCGCKKVRSYLF